MKKTFSPPYNKEELMLSTDPGSHWNQRSFAEQVEQARQNCQTCQTVQPDLVPLGAAIISANPETFDRRIVRQNRPFPDATYIGQGEGPIYIPTAGSPMVHRAEGRQGWNQSMPQSGPYNAELFKTPYDRTQPMESIGVVENPWTGEVFEAFVNQIPPPTTNKGALDPDQLKRTNPRLVWSQGGIDPNAPLRTKTEICQDIPGADWGPNVWGDQLFESKRREMMQQIVNRDIWNNRNGDYSIEPSLNGERPAGFVGLQPMYRALPHLPPTQILDNKDWTGPVGDPYGTSISGQPVPGQVFLHKPDLSEFPHTGLPEGINGNEARYVVGAVKNRPTLRGDVETLYASPAADQAIGAYVVLDTKVRDSLKELMDRQFPQQAANQEALGGHVVLDTVPRSTLKEFTEKLFPSRAASSQDTGGHVILDTKVRDTLKELMTKNFPAFGASDSSAGGHVILDTHVRDTLKELMARQFHAFAAANPGMGASLPFQGELEGTRREYYSDQPVIARVGDSAIDGQYQGAGAVNIHQFRGTGETYRISTSKVDAHGGDTAAARWNVGVSERDTPSEFETPRTFPNFTQDNGTFPTAGRLFGTVAMSCKRPDDIDDQFLSVRPTYFGEGSVS